MKLLCGWFLLAATVSLCAEISPPEKNFTESEKQIIAASESDAQSAPRFNGATVIGIHPGTPFLFSASASGARPISLSAKNLPAGLAFDPETGIISGELKNSIAPPPSAKSSYFLLHSVDAKKTFFVTLRASNSSGTALEKLKIVCGDTLALTPPMGWNSYDAFGDNVIESEVLANAHYLAEKMQPLGWNTVVVDYCWSDPGAHDNNRNARAGAALAADKFGRLLPAPNRFPSAAGGGGFKPLADQIHAMGLRFGIHVMRGIPRQAVRENTTIEGSTFTAAEAGNTNDRCAWCPDMFGVESNAAGQAWYDSSARLWASWGVDYIKVDDLSRPYHLAEVEMIRRAIDKSGRSIIFSTSPGETPVKDAANIFTHANLWRVSDDFWDNWKSLNHEFTLAARWTNFVGPGHWPDADMLPVGHLSVAHRSVGSDRFSHLTRDEQLTLISFWCLLPSPLMVGANLPDNDAWTLALLTNPEALALDQDPLGQPAMKIAAPDLVADIWVRKLSGGAHAVGLFNRSATPAKINFAWKKIGLPPHPLVRDLWLRKDLGRQENFSTEIPPHGCILLRVTN